MKKILLFTIGVVFSFDFYCQNFGDEMGKFGGVAAYYNPSGYVSNLYNYLNEVNTGMKWQCVEYVNRYYLQNYGINIRIAGQNAVDYYSNAAQRGLSAYPNGENVPPQVGDILCLSGNTYGHIAIISEVNSSHIKVIQQNSGNADYVNFSFPRSGNTIDGTRLGSGYTVQGWLKKAGTGAPLLSSPANNASFTKGNNIIFSWSTISNAAYYEIWIDNNEGFGSPEVGFNNGASSHWVNNGIVDKNDFTLYTNWQNQLEQNLYYWKIRALDANKQPLTGWSQEVRRFTLYNALPTLSSPENNAEYIKGNDITFYWNDVNTAPYYEIWIDNNEGFGSPEVGFNNGASSHWVNNGIVDKKSFTLTENWQNQLEQNLYFWKIRALNADKQPLTEWSEEVRRFTLLNNTVGLKDTPDNKNFEIYFNPVSCELNVATNGNRDKKLSIDILNLTGQVLYKMYVSDNAVIPMHNFSKGIYVVKIDDGEKHIARKIIKD